MRVDLEGDGSGMRSALLLSGLLFICAASLRADDGAPQRDRLRQRYEQILLRRPQRAAAFEWLYQSYGDDEGIDQWETRLREQEGDDAARLLVLGYIAERRGREADALSLYIDAAKQSPKDPLPPTARGMLLHRLRRYDEAVAALTDAIACDPPRDSDVALHRALGRAQLGAGQDDAALATWLKLADRYKDDPAIVEEVADLLAQQRRFDAAAAQYQRLAAMGDDPYRTVRAQIAIASMELEQKQTDEAIKRLTPVLESLAPDSWLRTEVRQRIEAAFLAAGHSDELIAFYKDWASRRSGDLDIAKALAQLHLRLDAPEEAERVLRNVTRRAPTDADAHRGLADLMLRQGRIAEAAEAQQKACNLEPADANGWRRLGQIHQFDDNLAVDERDARAEAAWRRIVDERPTDPTRALMAAELFRGADMTEQAVAYYRKLIALDPQNTAGHEHLGQYLHELDRDEEATAALLQMAAGDNDLPANHVRLAQLLDELDYDDEALAAIEAALQRVGKGAEAFDLTMRRHRILVDRKDYDNAEASLDQSDALAQTAAEHRDALAARVDLYQKQDVLNSRIDSTKDPLLRAMLLRAARRNDDAAGVVQTNIEADNAPTWQVAIAADVLTGTGRADEAIAMLRTLVRREPRHEAVHMRRIAELARTNRDWPTAIAAAQRMIALSPNQQEGYLLAADVYDEQEKPKDATEMLRDAVRRNPQDATLLAALAARLSHSGDASGAIDRYWRAFDAALDETIRLRFAADLARVHIESGRMDLLVEQWTRRRRDAQQETIATLALANAYRQAGMLDQAEWTLRDAARLRPGDVDILNQLLTLASDRGAIDEAIELARRLVAMPGSGAPAKRKLASLLNDAGRTDEAVALWRSLAGDVDQLDGDAAIQLAETFARNGLDEEAQRVVLDAAMRHPDDWRLRYQAATMIARSGDTDRAAELFDALIAMPQPASSAVAPAARPIWSGSPYASGNPSAEVSYWMYLPRLQQQLSTELQTIAMSFGQQVMRYTSGRNQSMPTDFLSIRTAALMHRLYAEQRSSTIKTYMNNLAARAGFTLTDDALKVEDPPKPAEGDAVAQDVLLAALLLLDLDDEAFRALQVFLADRPESLSLAALDAVFRAAPARVNSYMVGRPASLPDDIEADDAALRRLAELDPGGAAQLRMMYTQFIMQRKDNPVAVKWVEKALADETDLQRRAHLAMSLMNTGGRDIAADAIESMLPSLRELLQTQTNTQQYFSTVANLSRAASLLYTEPDDADRAMRITMQLLELAGSVQFPANTRGQSRVPLNGDAPPAFSQALFMVEPAEQYVLRVWQQAMKREADVNAAVTALSDRYEHAQGDAKDTAGRTLASLLAMAGRHEESRKVVEAIAERHPGDRAAQIELARLEAQGEKPDAALKRLAALDDGGVFADDALRLRLLIARQAKLDDPARDAARKLAAATIPPHERTLLDRHLQALGITVQLAAPTAPAQQSMATVTRRASAMNNPTTRRMEQLTRLAQQGDDGRDALIRLARRIVREKAMSPNNAAGDAEARAAANALVQAGALDAVLEDIQTQLETSPNNTSLLQQLWVYCTITNKRDLAHQVIERRLAAKPGDAYSRYQYAMSLCQSNRYAEAATQFEKVIESDPQLIQEGYTAYRAFDNAHRLERLVELIDGIDFKNQLTVVRNQDTSHWLNQIASNLERKSPALAIRVYLRQAAVTNQPHYEAASRTAALRLAAQTDNVRVVVENLAPLGSNSSAGTHFNTAQTLFTINGNQTVVLTAPPENSAPLQAIVRTLAKHKRLDALGALVKAGKSNTAWYDLLGRTIEVMHGLASEPRDVAGVEQYAVWLEEEKSLANQQYQTMLRAAACLLMVDELGRDQDTLPLAARFASIGLKSNQPNQMQIGAELSFHAALAHAAIVAGQRDRAKEHYRHLVTAEPAQRAQLVASGASHVAGVDMSTLQCKQSFISAMVADGFAGMAIDMLLAYDKSFSDAAGSHYTQQFDQLLTTNLTSEPMREALTDRLATMQESLKQKPDDAALTASLMRLYRLTGRDDEAMALAEQVAAPGAISPADRMALAQRLGAAGKAERGRQMIISLITEGEGHRLTNHSVVSMLFTTGEQWQALADAVEKLPLTQDVVARGEWWIVNLINAVPSPAPAEEKDARAHDRVRLRLLQAADRLTAARGDGAGADRRHLFALVRQMERVDGKDAACKYLRGAVVPGDDADAVTNFHRLFTVHSHSKDNVDCMATQLVDLAAESNQLDALAADITRAYDRHASWQASGSRLALLVAMRRDDMPAAEKWMRLVAAKPYLDPNQGYDISYLALAQRAAKHDDLRDAAMKMYETAWTSVLAAPHQSGQAMQLIAPLASTYVSNGQHESLQVMFARFVRANGAEHGAGYGYRLALGLCRFAGYLYDEAGDHARALDYYRVLLRHPFTSLNHIPGDQTRYGNEDIVVRVVKALQKDGKLEAYLATLPQDAPIESDPPRNVEPLTMRVTAQLLAGRLDEAAAAAALIRDVDFPAGAQVWACIASKSNGNAVRERARILSERVFIRWPALYNAGLYHVTNLYRREHRSAPLEGLEDTIRKVAAFKDAPQDEPAPPEVFDGTAAYAGMMPPPAWLYRSTNNVLRQYLRDSLVARNDEAKLALIGWMYQHMDADANVVEWIDARRTAKPNETYDVLVKMLSGEQGEKWPMSRLFTGSIGRSESIVPVQRCHAQVLIEAARDAGKLDAFAALCRDGSLSIEPGAAARLAMIADATAGVDAFAELWSQCMAGKQPFEIKAEEFSSYQFYEPALAPLVNLVPPKTGAQLIADALPPREQRVRALPHPAYDNFCMPVKRIELLAEAGERDAAIAAIGDVIERHSRAADLNEASRDTHFLERLARQHKWQAEVYAAMTEAAEKNTRLKQTYRHVLGRLHREVERMEKENKDAKP